MRPVLPLVLCALGCAPATTTTDGGSRDASARDARARDADTVRPPPAGPQAWFEDVTDRAGVTGGRPDDFGALAERMNGGVCVLDVDGEGPMDLFFALESGPEGGASLLYVAGEPLAFEDQTARRGLDAVGGAMGCLAFDAEGDGDDDLLVTGVGAIRLFVRQGDGFVERTEDLGLALDPRDMYTSAAAGDVDEDGDVDLLIGGIVRIDESRVPDGCRERCRAEVTHYEPIPNLLLVREADGTYTDATALAPDLLRAEMTQMVAITDLDGDGRVDLFVGNDIGTVYPNRPLVRDAGGIYRDDSLRLGLAYNAMGGGMCTMGWSAADIDGDGQLDHVVTSFADDATAVFLCADDFCEAQRPDLSGTAALAPTFRWGPALVDIDLDGRPDLVEATGHIFSDRTVGETDSRDQIPNVMWNEGGRFVPVEPSPESGRRPASTRGIAVTDLDEDGRPDIVLGATVGRPILLRNVAESWGASLRVRLEGAPPNTGGLGARVRVRDATGRLVGVQDRRAGEGYLGSFDPRLFFGLVGEAPFEVEVTWPSGRTTVVPDVAPGASIRVSEP